MATTYVYTQAVNRLVDATQTVSSSLGGEPVSRFHHTTPGILSFCPIRHGFWRVQVTGDLLGLPFFLCPSEDSGLDWLLILSEILGDVKSNQKVCLSTPPWLSPVCLTFTNKSQWVYLAGTDTRIVEETPHHFDYLTGHEPHVPTIDATRRDMRTGREAFPDVGIASFRQFSCPSWPRDASHQRDG